MKLAIIILAAGKGKRMEREDLPKVLVPLAEKPLLGHVLQSAVMLEPKKIVLIVGHLREKVFDYINRIEIGNISYAVQEEQLGTGHAVDMAKDELKDFDGDTVILAGDVPFITKATLEEFINHHQEYQSDCSVLSTIAPDPTGYGRIIRDDNGDFTKIIEHKDSSEEERKVEEINSGIFCVNNKLLFEALRKVSNNNVQGEYYLTDIVEILIRDNKKVMAFNLAKFDELQGVNSPDDLLRAEEVYNKINIHS